MPFEDKQILVVGGTGVLGQPVVHTLDHFGFPVRIFSRQADRARELFGNQSDIATGDIENEDSLLRALRGCYGVHINLKGSYLDKSFDKIEYQGTRKIVEAALKSDIKRISYISGASVAGDRQRYPGVSAKYKAEQEIIGSGLEYAIFRATWFMESLPLFIRDNQATVMGSDNRKIHWLAAEDYARIVTRAFMMEDKLNHIFTVFGPEAYTFREALGIYIKNVNPKIKIKQVPLRILKFFAAITFSKQLKDILPFMDYFNNTGELGDPTETDEMLGTPQISLEDWCKSIEQNMNRRR